MATRSVLISIGDYLKTSYRPDREYIDGELLERHVDKWDHARIQALLCIWFGSREHNWNVVVATGLRVMVSSSRVRIPDVCLVSIGPRPPVLLTPPLLVVEILSSDDTYASMTQRCNDYIRMGVPALWIVDLVNRTGHMWTSGTWTETVTPSVPGSPIHVDLNTILISSNPRTEAQRTKYKPYTLLHRCVRNKGGFRSL
jgi:Uma2 family endonuclease